MTIIPQKLCIRIPIKKYSNLNSQNISFNKFFFVLIFLQRFFADRKNQGYYLFRLITTIDELEMTGSNFRALIILLTITSHLKVQPQFYSHILPDIDNAKSDALQCQENIQIFTDEVYQSTNMCFLLRYCSIDKIGFEEQEHYSNFILIYQFNYDSTMNDNSFIKSFHILKLLLQQIFLYFNTKI